jgi:hypothetical protein
MYGYTFFFTPLGFLFLLCMANQQIKYKRHRGPPNEHPYQVWFQLAKSYKM